MPVYKIINVRPESKEKYNMAQIEYQKKQGKKIDGLDFFDKIVESFCEVVLNGNRSDKKDI